MVEMCVTNLSNVSAKSILRSRAWVDARTHLHLVRVCALRVCHPSEKKLRQVKNANWTPCLWLFPLNSAQKREEVPSALFVLPKAIADLWIHVEMPSVAQPAWIVEEKFHFDSGFQENKTKKKNRGKPISVSSCMDSALQWFAQNEMQKKWVVIFWCVLVTGFKWITAFRRGRNVPQVFPPIRFLW